MGLIQHIEQLLKVKIKDERLLKTAFRHTSYANEQRSKNLEHNERLEFLGDAVLEVVVSNYLYRTYPKDPEGFLTRTRAQLVREESLALLARQYNFNDFLQLGHGEERSGGRERNSILADAFEAFIGAIYLDQSIDVVTQFLNEAMLGNHQALIKQVNQDYKTLLQEILQQNGNIQIHYELINKTGPAHNQLFEMGLYVDEKLVATGKGKSKKLAEMEAAKVAYSAWDEKGN